MGANRIEPGVTIFNATNASSSAHTGSSGPVAAHSSVGGSDTGAVAQVGLSDGASLSAEALGAESGGGSVSGIVGAIGSVSASVSGGGGAAAASGGGGASN